MDLQQIEAFVKIAHVRNFTRAASALNRSQPAVTRRITLLERDLGTRLFERVRGEVQLTLQGKALLPHAEAILASVRDARQALRQALTPKDGVLHLALVGTLLDSDIAKRIRNFRHGSRRVSVELRTGTSQEVSRLVTQGEATLGIRYFHDPSPRLIVQTLGEERMVVIARPEPRNKRPPADLSAARWIGFAAMRAQPEWFGNILRQRLQKIGVDESRIMVVDSLAAQKRLVENGFGVALVPQSSVREELRTRTLVLREAQQIETSIPIVAVQRRSAIQSAAEQSLLEMLKHARMGSGMK